MKVILRTNVEKLGKIGETIDVKEGFAMNYLIPRNYAYPALPGKLASLAQEKAVYDKRLQKEIGAAQKVASELEKVQVSIPVQVGEEDKIFGSVTAQMIGDALKEKGFELDKRKIELDEPIKTLGIFDVKVRLHSSVSATIKVWVVRE